MTAGRVDTFLQLTKRASRGFRIVDAGPSADERGIALVMTLILLVLMSVLGLAMVLSMSSDMLINGYYRNYRGAFYAADSGLNIARQQLGNQTVLAFPLTPVTGWTAPPLADPSTTVSSYITTHYGASFTPLTGSSSGQAANSWSGSFEVVSNSKCWPNASPVPSVLSLAGTPTVTSTNSLGQNTGYQYVFNYNLCAMGRALASQQVDTSETGSLIVNISVPLSQTATTQTSFAAFGAFINNYSPCTGALIAGTMTGPMFTNGAWEFGSGGAYTFTDPVGQVNANADYWFGGNCIQSPNSSYKSGSQTIAPNFEQGLNVGQTAVALPANAFAQEWAVLDGKGTGEGSSAPTASQLNSVLKTISGTKYPSTGATSGVYLPYSSVSGTNTLSGGGLYVEGSAAVQLSIGNDTASPSNPTQIYTITQGGTTTTITTDPGANTTTVSSGSTVLTLAGVPENLTGTIAQPGTMLYVDGTITSLSGTGQGQPAVQDGSQITITAAGNVDITGDLLYKTEPVTTTQNQIVAGTTPPCCAGTPVATLIPGSDKNQDIGIFTATGNIQLSSSYSNQNLEVDGSLAAIGQSCASNSCGFTVSGAINTFNNVGGQIQGNIFGANMQTENTYFDRRYTSRPGFAPPWFPSTTIQSVDITNAATPVLTPTMQRISWLTSPQ
jgi:Tfp pilus assembly protein PilX